MANPPAKARPTQPTGLRPTQRARPTPLRRDDSRTGPGQPPQFQIVRWPYLGPYQAVLSQKKNVKMKLSAPEAQARATIFGARGPRAQSRRDGFWLGLGPKISPSDPLEPQKWSGRRIPQSVKKVCCMLWRKNVSKINRPIPQPRPGQPNQPPSEQPKGPGQPRCAGMIAGLAPATPPDFRLSVGHISGHRSPFSAKLPSK